MMTLAQLTELLGWASVLNIGFILFATVLVVSMKSMVISIHRKIFDISEYDISLVYFRYLANYKLLTLVFVVVPYLSLKIMEQ